MKSPASAISSFVIGYFLVLALATFAAYSSIGGSEVLRWDDNVYLNHELVQSLRFDNLLAILYTQHHSNWHPLTTLSFAIENGLWGQNAVYAKLVNICLHLLASFLFYLLSFRLLLLATEPAAKTAAQTTGHAIFADRNRFARFAGLFAATLFALHPQHVEAVAWVSERKGLLCAVFYLAALISYIRASTGTAGHRLNLTLVFVLLALMSKPMAVSLPIAMMLLDVYPLRKTARMDFSLTTIRLLLRGKTIYLLVTLASVLITLLYQDPQGEAVLGYLPRLINACAAYLYYIGAVFYPPGLSPFHPFLEFSRNPSGLSLIPPLLFGGLAAAAVFAWIRQKPLLPVIFAYYVISLLPVIGIVKVGLQSMADRYAYLPTIWLYLLLGVATYSLLMLCKNHLQRYLGGVVFVALCLALGLITNEHTRHWRNDVLLWQKVIERYPDDASIAYVNLASAHAARGDMAVAETEKLILRALELAPDEPYNLRAAANFYGALGQEQKALELTMKMAGAAPYNYWAREQIGDVYFKRGDFANAGDYYLEALRLGSESEEVIYRLAWIDLQFKRFDTALSKLALLKSPHMSQRKAELEAAIRQARSASAQ